MTACRWVLGLVANVLRNNAHQRVESGGMAASTTHEVLVTS